MKKLFSYTEGNSSFEVLMNASVYKMLRSTLIIFVLYDLITGGTERWIAKPIFMLHDFVSSPVTWWLFGAFCMILFIRWLHFYFRSEEEMADPPIAIRKTKTDDDCH